jgi:hypothetical protein
MALWLAAPIGQTTSSAAKVGAKILVDCLSLKSFLCGFSLILHLNAQACLYTVFVASETFKNLTEELPDIT